MTDTVDLQIMKAIYALLKADPVMTDVVFHDRPFSLEQDKLPSIDVDILDAQPEQLSKSVHAYEVAVAVTVQAADDLALDKSSAEIADPLVASIHALLMQDRTLGGLCAQINPAGRRQRRADMDGSLRAVESLWSIKYACEANDIRKTAR